MLAIIGCGNPNRSDDGAGVAVVHELMRREEKKPHQNTRIFDTGTDGMGVMFKARGAAALIVIDASSTGAEAGAVFTVPGHELAGKPPASFNLHDFRWDHALYAGRQIFKENFPTDVTVYLIESGNLDFGLGLSDSVARSVQTVVDTISSRIDEYEHAEV